MVLGYKYRDFRHPRINILEETGIKPGDLVLDYGCGPGSYIEPTAELVGKSGMIYAIDLHPLAIQRARNIASRKKLNNLKTILSDCNTVLPDESIDLALLYDVYHDLSDPKGVLGEVHRVLKPAGILSFSDHHMKENEILLGVTSGGLFKFAKKGERTYSFVKAEPFLG